MSVIYLYGFVPGDAALPAAGLLGVGDAPVDLMPIDGFAAALARLDAGDYGPAELETRGGDMEWMAEQGLRHEQVVTWFVDHSTIVPSGLLTLFSSTDALRTAAAAERATILGRLERFATVREWDLKVEYDPVVLGRRLGEVSDDIADLDRRIDAASPGKRFLLERKRKDLVRSEGRAAARRLARDLLGTLEREATDSQLIPPPTDDAPVVLNAAVLLPRESEAAIVAAVRADAERLEELGVHARLTGPWAPYRFMGADDG